MMSELAPCPFCGNTATAVEGDGRYYICCLNPACYTAIGEAYYHDMPDYKFSTENDAVAAWNTRATLTPLTEDEKLARIVATNAFLWLWRKERHWEACLNAALDAYHDEIKNPGCEANIALRTASGQEYPPNKSDEGKQCEDVCQE